LQSHRILAFPGICTHRCVQLLAGDMVKLIPPPSYAQAREHPLVLDQLSAHHAGRPLLGRFSSSSLGWLRRQDSFSWSERRSRSSRRLSSSSSDCLLPLRSRSRSSRRSVMGPSFAIAAGRPCRPDRRGPPWLVCVWCGRAQRGILPVYAIYDVYDAFISSNSITRRVEEAPSGLTTRPWRARRRG
jgi:hypothetical protein